MPFHPRLAPLTQVWPVDRKSGTELGRVLAVVALAGAGGLLVLGLVLAGSYALTHAGPPCTNPPQRESNPAQWVVVGICLVAFVTGHMTARWQRVDPSRTRRHLEPTDPPDKDPRKREALIVQALLLAFLLEIVGLLIIEVTTLSNGVWPITYYVRCAYDAAGWPSTATAAAILFLAGRWFWLPPRKEANARTRT